MRAKNRALSALTSLTFAILLASLASLAACGGKSPEAKAPDPAGATAPTGSPTAEPTSSTPSTTTATLSGNDPGTKLPAAGTAAPKTDDAPKKGAEPGRGRDDIQAIVAARRDEARACYDEGLKKNPSLEGDLDIKWTIDPDGNVKDAGDDASRSTIHDKDVTACIAAIIQRVKFARSAKGFETRTHYPFNFHPKTGQVGKGGAQGGPPKN